MSLISPFFSKIEESMIEQTPVSEWTNFLEVRAYGLMRSGNHAIIEWAQNQHSDHITCFLNNVRHGNHDPYTNHKRRILTCIDEKIDIDDLRTMRKQLLIYSYEDRDELESENKTFLDSVFQKDFEVNRKNYLGPSRHQLDVLIIRDPFNFLASRLKLLQVRGPLDGVSNPVLIMKNWKILAKEALNVIRYPQPGKMVVTYNRWVTDISYRQCLSQRLMGTFNDSSMRSISQFGGGSSFKNPDRLTISMMLMRWKKLFSIERFANFGHYWRRFTAPNNEKKVFERWKHFSKDESFLDLVLDDEILELSEKLFGETPGIREFLKTQTRKND